MFGYVFVHVIAYSILFGIYSTLNFIVEFFQGEKQNIKGNIHSKYIKKSKLTRFKKYIPFKKEYNNYYIVIKSNQGKSKTFPVYKEDFDNLIEGKKYKINYFWSTLIGYKKYK